MPAVLTCTLPASLGSSAASPAAQTNHFKRRVSHSISCQPVRRTHGQQQPPTCAQRRCLRPHGPRSAALHPGGPARPALTPCAGAEAQEHGIDAAGPSGGVHPHAVGGRGALAGQPGMHSLACNQSINRPINQSDKQGRAVRARAQRQVGGAAGALEGRAGRGGAGTDAHPLLCPTVPAVQAHGLPGARLAASRCCTLDQPSCQAWAVLGQRSALRGGAGWVGAAGFGEEPRAGSCTMRGALLSLPLRAAA